MSKIKIVEDILYKKGYISNIECVETKLTWRLGDIIFRLRKQGENILTIMPEDTKKYDCRYYLADTDNHPIRKIPKGYKIAKV